MFNTFRRKENREWRKVERRGGTEERIKKREGGREGGRVGEWEIEKGKSREGGRESGREKKERVGREVE